MPRARVVMRKIREVLRLTLGERLSQRRVRQITGVPESTIYDYLKSVFSNRNTAESSSSKSTDMPKASDRRSSTAPNPRRTA